MDPHAAFLLERGLKTIDLRVKEQGKSAGRIAKVLEDHPTVSVVHYPGLESHAQHERATRLLDGFGGMLSFELVGDVSYADDFLSAVTLPTLAVSLGGIESLIVRPAQSTHASLSDEQLDKIGLSDKLIRLSVGLEDVHDLIADMTSALEIAKGRVST